MAHSTATVTRGKTVLPLIGGKRVPGLVLGTFPGFDGRRVVVIATFRTANRKTGNMVQVWILRAHGTPLDAITNGTDATVCGTCPHRSRAAGGMGTCYVNVAHAPQGVWKAWQRGTYPQWDGGDDQFAAAFGGRAVRFGAYGDPALIPPALLARIASVARRWTGYTHAWTRAGSHAAYLMASVDSPRERDNARSHGWRTFQVTPQGGAPTPASDGGREILCPASEEAGKRTDCASCGLCAGNGRPAADVMIPAHGASARRISLPTL
jgi:hypothetical protein